MVTTVGVGFNEGTESGREHFGFLPLSDESVKCAAYASALIQAWSPWPRGVDVWWDREGIGWGDNWIHKIENALTDVEDTSFWWVPNVIS